jgi:hypothetical protein
VIEANKSEKLKRVRYIRLRHGWSLGEVDFTKNLACSGSLN